MANPILISFQHKQTALRRNFVCEKCGDKIEKGESYWRSSDGHRKDSGNRYCIPCVGFIASRYSFVDISKIGEEEKKWKKYWDDEIQAKIRGLELSI